MAANLCLCGCLSRVSVLNALAASHPFSPQTLTFHNNGGPPGRAAPEEARLHRRPRAAPGRRRRRPTDQGGPPPLHGPAADVPQALHAGLPRRLGRGRHNRARRRREDPAGGRLVERRPAPPARAGRDAAPVHPLGAAGPVRPPPPVDQLPELVEQDRGGPHGGVRGRGRGRERRGGEPAGARRPGRGGPGGEGARGPALRVLLQGRLGHRHGGRGERAHRRAGGGPPVARLRRAVGAAERGHR